MSMCNMLGYLSTDIICSEKRTICELRGTDNVQGQISEHIFKGKLRLLSLLSLKYFSQQAGSASPSYVNTSKFVNWLPKPRHSIFISRISNRLRFS